MILQKMLYLLAIMGVGAVISVLGITIFVILLLGIKAIIVALKSTKEDE